LGINKAFNGLVVLLTDYGHSDYYVGALKGSIYSVYPEARIDDITQQVTPFNIWEGAYTLSLAAKEFPKGTVFIAVVDPGVGTGRKAIVLETEDGKLFVAPDNGLLTFVAEEMGVAGIWEIKNKAYMRPKRSFSATFHGRDIFGPVGAYLASGLPLSRVGTEMNDFVRLKIPRAIVRNGKIKGQVIRVDIYGNVITNISDDLLNEAGIRLGDLVIVNLSEHTFPVRFVRTYGEVPKGEKLCHLESRKLLEVSLNMGHLANQLGINVGDQVVVYREGHDKKGN
jgi:S-adenosylmethionine hydrolase